MVIFFYPLINVNNETSFEFVPSNQVIRNPAGAYRCQGNTLIFDTLYKKIIFTMLLIHEGKNRAGSTQPCIAK